MALMQNDALAIFIGHDGKEAVATDVCERSIRETAGIPVHIQRIHEPALRYIGLYRREWTVTDGVRFDGRDRRPFSTSFAFARFLVPSLMQHRGWALFVDGDFLFLKDVKDLFAQADDQYAAMVVQHGARPEAGTKMDGQLQQPYFRKNWSSCVLFNCGHASNHRLGPHQVNTMSGQWLHGFSWLEDREIGALDPRWNWLSGIDKQPASGDPFAVHFTRGAPFMAGYEGSPYAEHWRKVKARL
jgi:lipopolysaccharide biosynthesis glycosyltransferase